jgi:hypothetical protein
MKRDLYIISVGTNIPEKVYINIREYGNMLAASLGLGDRGALR